MCLIQMSAFGDFDEGASLSPRYKMHHGGKHICSVVLISCLMTYESLCSLTSTFPECLWKEGSYQCRVRRVGCMQPYSYDDREVVSIRPLIWITITLDADGLMSLFDLLIIRSQTKVNLLSHYVVVSVNGCFYARRQAHKRNGCTYAIEQSIVLSHKWFKYIKQVGSMVSYDHSVGYPLGLCSTCTNCLMIKMLNPHPWACLNFDIVF